MNIEWLKNKSKEKVYPISHEKAILCGENSDKTLETTLNDIKNGTVANAAKVNGLTVETAVPANAKFTDTVYDDTAIKTQLNNKVPNTLTVNGKALSNNISLTASDVGADKSGAAAQALADAKSYADTLVNGLINGES